MAIKFQYNKTSLQQIEKNLKMRQRTLPIIKSKETALRLEVKRCKEDAVALEEKLKSQIGGYESMYALWGEFDANLVALKDVELEVKKIAGVRVPVLKNIQLEVKPFGLFSSPKWYFDGIRLLQGLAKTAVEREFVMAKLGLLDHARKKTTQKVNLFEKVQIPGFQEAVRKIKRFMEDEENLSKSSQKILKSLQEKRRDADGNGIDDADDAANTAAEMQNKMKKGGEA
jgi:V/A-type H+-transporting ATPase subunit D